MPASFVALLPPVPHQCSAPSPPALVVQASRRGRKKDSDDDDDYIPKSEQRQPRYSFKKGAEERVLKRTGHLKKNFNRKKYTSVYTCRGCGRPLGYIDLSGSFGLTKYSYHSKKKNKLHTIRAVANDHDKPWAKRLERLKQRRATTEEMKEDYQDESQLRSLCKRCNEKHSYENKKLPDYDSDDDGPYDPPTPTDEPDNSGRFSSFWSPPPPPPPGGTGITV